ncbi:malto-oligosyltrehalose trehalohydrolase [Arthrobacter mobilis]|uniref:Malto-oligosyltrehalose trehalohydrolase n=1 Tax=Arthrobacter mobilis TaxID=2724944 RepID=A0A7X6HAU6_9MICC|nr:malto-oligosyltrehalose trehalohydrolase [Arthrobacter mobilis]NKX53652.1 malto-oligosyltrehalose trehalohydrolase [Arthrobacter mobilis]
MSTDFAVWAPRAGRVDLAVGSDGRRLPLEASGGGWWRLPGAAAGGLPAGELDYGYSIDGSDPLPDPRSRRQPEGVHKLSRTFDPSAHRWQDAGWRSPGLHGSVIYELHVGTFTPEGTLDAAAGKLEYLAGLGVDFVELLPVNAFNGTHNWGYDGVLWFAVQETYGGPAAYQRFVDQAHQHGIGVIQDVVYNHLGPSGNYLPQYGPYLAANSVNTWGDSVNLDGPGSDEVRAYILDNLRMWFHDYHVDGLRLDAVHALHDERAVHLLEEAAAATDDWARQLDKPLFLIAESDMNNPRLLEPRTVNGYGLAAQWSDDFHHAAHVNLTGETQGYYADFNSLAALAKVLSGGFFHDGSYSSFRERHHGRPINSTRVGTHQLVVCTQNHDQIGNRAAGDRITAHLDYGSLAVAAVLTLASPFTPMLFMGEEYGASTPWQFFTSHPEPELGEATAQGRLKEFERMGWDPATVPNPQDPATFARSKLDWAEAEQGDHARLLELYRELIALRRKTPELTDPDFTATTVDFDEDARWLALHRGAVTVCLNFGAGSQHLGPGVGEILLATDDGIQMRDGGVQLPAKSAAILRRQ